jgi:hypothetical protein
MVGYVADQVDVLYAVLGEYVLAEFKVEWVTEWGVYVTGDANPHGAPWVMV